MSQLKHPILKEAADLVQTVQRLKLKSESWMEHSDLVEKAEDLEKHLLIVVDQLIALHSRKDDVPQKIDGMEVYDFGFKCISPKPELKTPFEAMAAGHDLQERVKRLQDYAGIRGRPDHFIKDLDILRYSCQEVLFETMVIREAITGNKTREDFEAKEKKNGDAHENQQPWPPYKKE